MAVPGAMAGVRWSVVLCAAWVAGCASLAAPAPETTQVVVPLMWTGGQSSGTVTSAEALSTPSVVVPAVTLTARWWDQLGDAQLTGLIDQALQANSTVRKALAAVQQARALVDVQAAGLQPSVSGSGSAQRSRSSGATSNLFQTGLDAQWEVDLFGRLRAGLSAAEWDALAAQASLGDAQVSLAAEVALAYVELRSVQQRLAIARSNLASQSETLQLARWRLQAGLTTSLVVEQARSAAEQTAAQVPALEASQAKQRHALAVMTGQAPAALDTQLGNAAAIPLPVAEIALEIPAQTLRQRADVRAAEHRISAALARVAQADAARYPSFNLSGSVGLRALTLGALTSAGAGTGALLAGLSIPLLDGGAARAQVRSQEAALEQARVAYEAAVLSALQDVEDALSALQGDCDRLVRLQAAAEAATHAALLAQQRYASGLIDFQTVLETQRTQLSTQDAVVTTQAAVAADHVRLYKALGGGWQASAIEPSARAARAAQE